MSRDNSRLDYVFEITAKNAKQAFNNVANAGYLTGGRYIVIKNLKKNSKIFKF